MQINVRASNSSPILQPIGARTLIENQAFQLQLVASDPDGDALTYSATGLPPGAMFNAQTGLFTWTPNYFTAGEYDVTFR